MILKPKSSVDDLDAETTVFGATLVGLNVLSGSVTVTVDDPVANTAVGQISLPAGFHAVEKASHHTLVANTAGVTLASAIAFR